MPRLFLCLALLSGIAAAAPKLRLSTAAVGPIFITQGQIGATQSVAVTNAGDGALSISALANVPWIATTTSATSIQILLNTASLARGKYTGIVTVSDPNAIDAPQTISVTIQVGDPTPDSLEFFLAPGGAPASSTFSSGVTLTVNAANFSAGPQLSIASTGAGSFNFISSYLVTASAPIGTPSNDYSASLNVSGPLTKTIPVTAHVTTLPIAQWTNPSVFRIAQGAAPVTQVIGFGNIGQGALTLSTVTGAPSWLTATVTGNVLILTADPSGLSPSVNQATLTVATNARNGPFTIPVELDVLTPGPPFTGFQRVEDNVLFSGTDALAPGEWIALIGEQLTTGPPKLGTFPLSGPVGGAAVFVNDQPAPVYYVSANQIDFVIPFATPAGDATVRVDRDGQRGNTVSVKIVPAAPRLLRLGIGDYANAQLNSTTLIPIPANLGIPGQPAKAGVDVVVFYAFGLGQTSPAAADGQPAPQGQIPPPVHMVIDENVLPGSGVSVTPLYAGFTPGFVGLYQINIALPANAPHGDAIPVYLDMNGVVSNKVNIAIQ